MKIGNQTILKEFILVGYPHNTQASVLFFVTLLLMYIFTILGNIFLIITVAVSPKLHQPMYFFLCNLSFLDLGFSSVSLPVMLTKTFSRTPTISFTGCMVQMYSATFLACTESLLLAVMAYDRYVAICFPLYYHTIINWKMCRYINITMWSASFFLSVVPYVSNPLVFCTENRVDHFVCEMLAVLGLACQNVAVYGLTLLILSAFALVVPLVFIIVSYIHIISSVVKMKSADGISKAFSTCVSHLLVVSMFYGTSITMYVGQTKSFLPNLKYISLVYGVVTPVLNPMIYSLRNNSVKEAFQKILTNFFL